MEVEMSELITETKDINTTLAELEEQRLITKQVNEIINECKLGTRKLHNLQVYPKFRQVFPTYDNDNLESVVKRFIKFFPGMADEALKQFKPQLENNETGFSKENTVKRLCDIPAPVYYSLKSLDPDYWGKGNFKHYREFISLCPKLATRNKHRQVTVK
jgi:hypothetical protein